MASAAISNAAPTTEPTASLVAATPNVPTGSSESLAGPAVEQPSVDDAIATSKTIKEDPNGTSQPAPINNDAQPAAVASTSSSAAALPHPHPQLKNIMAMLDEDQLDLVVEAAAGLDAEGQPLPGFEHSHRQLADALKAFNGLLKKEGKGIKQDNGRMRTPGKRLSSGGYSDAGGSGQKRARTAASVAAGKASGSPANGGRGRASTSRRASATSPGTRGESPDKPFICEVCQKCFSRKWNLATHQIIHQTDRETLPCPYPGCKRAIQGFTRKNDLQRHITAVHEGEDEPMESGADDESAAGRGNRQVSKLVKLGLARKGKHRCVCGRSFVRRDAMKRHRCEKKTGNANPLGCSIRYGSSTSDEDDDEEDDDDDEEEEDGRDQEGDEVQQDGE